MVVAQINRKENIFMRVFTLAGEVITVLMFLFLILLFVALTITTENMLDLVYVGFLLLCFTRYVGVRLGR